jgi:hypothetical protein
MRKFFLAAAGAALLAAPARAGDTKMEGWYVAGEAAWLGVSDDDLILATPSDLAGNPTGELVSMDFGTRTAYKLAIGFKNAEWGDFSVSYWRYSNSSAASADSNGGYYPNFGSPFNSNYYDPTTGTTSPAFYNHVDGRARLRSFMLDLTWARPFAKTERSEWEWSAGIRHWDLEQLEWRNGCRYIAGGCSFAYPYRFENDSLRSDARGTGLTLGINGRMNFTEKFWVSSSLKFAFLGGRVDARHLVTNYWPDPAPSTFYNDDLSATHKSRTFTQIEADLRLNCNIAGGFNGFVGYQFKKLDSAVTVIEHGVNVFTFDATPRTHNISMNGVVGGLSYIW